MRFAHDSSLCGGSLWGAASADAGGFRLCGGGISCLRARPKDGARLAASRSPFGNLRPITPQLYEDQRWQVAAALSAAVTTTKFIGDTHNAQAEPSRKKRITPTASRSSGEGVWGRGASLREAASPPESPNSNSFFGREREGGGFSTEKPPPSHYFTPTSPTRFCAWA